MRLQENKVYVQLKKLSGKHTDIPQNQDLSIQFRQGDNIQNLQRIAKITFQGYKSAIQQMAWKI